jgi:thioredoxin reductase (NADPH)
VQSGEDRRVRLRLEVQPWPSRPPSRSSFVVDEDSAAVEALVGDLERRFQADFRVMAETSAHAALERLAALREAGEQVALIICAESMRAMSGSELLARSRSTHPDAKRILLIDFSDQRMLEVIARGMALGRVEYYLTKPWRPREHLLYPMVGEAVVAWTRLSSRGYALVRVVGDHWNPRSFAVRDALERNNVPYAFYDLGSPEGGELLKQLEQVPVNPVIFLADGRVLTSNTRAAWPRPWVPRWRSVPGSGRDSTPTTSSSSAPGPQG